VIAATRPSATAVSVVIASAGRPEMLAQTINQLRRQSRLPNRIILSVTSPADLPVDPALLADTICLTGPRGLTAQRNTALVQLGPTSDVVVFLDDDYVPTGFAIARIADFFAKNTDVVGATGAILADGINGPGISVTAALQITAKYDATPPSQPKILRDLHGLYGCNMAFRGTALTGVRFDERLKLYGWQEDIDFSARLKARGRLVKTDAFAGVHLGVKHGRTAGIRLGYSQVINPIYLSRKGTMRVSAAFKLVAKTFIANHLRLFRPEAWVDRPGRVRGNWLGLFDCLRGRLTPERIEAL
jgi:GT2 family glycosyltransferase